MAQNFGYLEQKQADGKTYFEGVFTLPQITGKVFLVPRDKRSDNSPDFTLKLRTDRGTFEHGSAWSKKMRNGSNMVSITVDAPHMAQPVYVAGFPDDDKTGRFNVVWSRPRAGAATRPAEGGETGVPFDA